jgi:hypothetical protein
MGGGSVPHLPVTIDQTLLAAIPRMKPFDPDDSKEHYGLTEPGRAYLIYAGAGERIVLDLSGVEGKFSGLWMDPKSGKTVSRSKPVSGGINVSIPITFKPCLLWLKRL